MGHAGGECTGGGLEQYKWGHERCAYEHANGIGGDGKERGDELRRLDLQRGADADEHAYEAALEKEASRFAECCVC